MKVVTVINDVNNVYYNLLKLSCILNKLELVTLVSSNNNFYTRRIKDYLLVEYLSSDEIEDDEIIFFTDGTDALFTCNESEILRKFKSFNKDIVFSAETGCWPDTGLATDYPKMDAKTPYKYLNSGGFIGNVKVIRELLDDNDFDLKQFHESNQYLWTKRYLKNLDKIGLDNMCTIFCTFSPEIGQEYLDNPKQGFPYYQWYKKNWFNDNFSFLNNRITNKITSTTPCHLHFNGHSKLLIGNEIYSMVYDNLKQVVPTQYYYEEE